MNNHDFEILEKIKELASEAKPIRHARISRKWQREEVALSFFPAAIIEPAKVDTLSWSETPTWQYRLVHYSIIMLARGAIGSRAHAELTAAAAAITEKISEDLTLGGLAADGPPLGGAFGGSIAATRLGPTELASQEAGSPLAYVLKVASGYFPDAMPGSASFRGLSLFSSGPHVVIPGPVDRRSLDRTFNGLVGTLSLDLGEGPREITQQGHLSSPTLNGLKVLENQIEACIDGTPGMLVDTDGTQYENCRMESFQRIGPPERGTQFHRAYTIRYLQLAR